MDWSRLTATSNDFQVELVQGTESSFSLSHQGAELAFVQVTIRDASVAHLRWELSGGSVGSTAEAIRRLIAALYASGAMTRVEVIVDHTDAIETQVAMRTGLRREGILRGGLMRANTLRDGALFASVTDDPSPDSAGGFTGMLDSVMPLKRLISHVVMTDPQGRILLCETTFKKDWELPGGIVEPGEAPMLGAQREVAEELGIDIEVGALLAVDWLPPYLGWSDAIEVLYDGGQYDADLPDRLTYQAREIKRAEWVAIEDVAPRVSPLNARRLPLLVPTKPARTLNLQDGRLAD